MGGPLHNIIRPIHRDNHPRFRVSLPSSFCSSRSFISSLCNLLTMHPVALLLADVDMPASARVMARVGFWETAPWVNTTAATKSRLSPSETPLHLHTQVQWWTNYILPTMIIPLGRVMNFMDNRRPGKRTRWSNPSRVTSHLKDEIAERPIPDREAREHGRCSSRNLCNLMLASIKSPLGLRERLQWITILSTLVLIVYTDHVSIIWAFPLSLSFPLAFYFL